MVVECFTCSLPCRRSIIGTNIAANCDDVDDDMVDVVGDVIDNGPRGRTNDASLESVSIFVIWRYTGRPPQRDHCQSKER